MVSYLNLNHTTHFIMCNDVSQTEDSFSKEIQQRYQTFSALFQPIIARQTRSLA